jgi:hypothetical protein
LIDTLQWILLKGYSWRDTLEGILLKGYSWRDLCKICEEDAPYGRIGRNILYTILLYGNPLSGNE